MKSTTKTIALLMLALFFLLSCQLLTNEASETGDVTNASITTSLPLMEYVPANFVDTHEAGIGPWIIFLDFAQMRSDLGLQNISGDSSRQEKLPLITGMRTQNLGFIPSGFENVIGSSAFTNLGWDIADIDQSLYLPDFDVAVLRGRFERSEIQEKLNEKGYTTEKLGDFILFSNDGTYSFAWKPDTLIIGKEQYGENFLNQVVEFYNSNNQNMSVHPTVQNMLPKLMESSWGTVFLPSPDFVALSEKTKMLFENLSPEIAGPLQEKMTDCTAQPAKWDFMAISYLPDGEQYTIQLIYRYSSDLDAQSDADLVQMTLTETPSLTRRGVVWGDMVSIDNLSIEENLIIVKLHTDRKELLGIAITKQDEWGLLPVRCK